MYFVGEIHKVPSSSLVTPILKWNVIGPVPLSLNLCLFFRIIREFFGVLHSIAKSSMYTAMYSYILLFFLIQMSGFALHGKNLSSLIQSANLLCHVAPLLHKPYKASYVRFKVVIPYVCCPKLQFFNSAKNKTSLNPCKLTAPEYTKSCGILLRCPSGTSLALCLPSYLTSYTR
jgi:hypothetical protein